MLIELILMFELTVPLDGIRGKDMLSLALMAAKAFAPSIIGSLMGSKAEKVAEDVVGIATKITGIDDPQEAVDHLGKNPELALQFKQSVMEYELAMAKEDTKRLETVNETMRAEARSEHWMQWSWRPFNGYLFGITLFFNYVMPSLYNMFAEVHIVAQQIPEFVLMAWAAILGVTAWHRGVQKRIISGEVKKKTSIADAIKALRK